MTGQPTLDGLDAAPGPARAHTDPASRSLQAGIAAAVFNTPAGYPDDIATAVMGVPELQQLIAQAAAVERVRRLALRARDRTAAGLNDWQIGQHELANAVLDILGEQPKPEKLAHDAGPSVREAAAQDRAYWTAKYAGGDV